MAGLEYKVDAMLTTRSVEEYEYWQGTETNFDFKYLFNEQRDDFGLLIAPANELIVDFDLGYNPRSLEDEEYFRSNNIGIKKQFGKHHSVFFGDKILIWGKADRLNPLDVWNAEDFEYFITRNKALRKIARTMLVYEYQKTNKKLQFVAALNDSRSYHDFPRENNVWCNRHCRQFSTANVQRSAQSLSQEAEFNSFSTEGMDIGFRFSHKWEKIDYSIMAYHGADRFPYYEKNIGSGVVEFTPYQEAQTQVGFDLSRVVGKYNVIFENKYQFSRPYFKTPTTANLILDDNGLIFSDEYTWILGIDRTLTPDLFANLQIYQRHIFLDSEDLYDFGGTDFLTFLLRYSHSESLRFEYLNLYELNTSDLSERFSVLYTYSDKLNFEASAQFFGSENNDSFFAGLNESDTYTFDMHIIF